MNRATGGHVVVKCQGMQHFVRVPVQVIFREKYLIFSQERD